MANELIEKPQVSLDICAMCCVGEAKFEYDVETKQNSFIVFESYMEQPEIEPATDLEYFYYLLNKHLNVSGGELNQKQLDDFVKDFLFEITKES